MQKIFDFEMAQLQLEDFSERKPHRNLGLEVEEKTFWVSRESLADVSSVFNAMFYGEGEFKEKAKDVIQLPDKNADEILEFLRCLFTYKEIDNENVDILLKFCDEYDVKYLIENCKKFLVKQVGLVIQLLFSQGQEKIIKLFLTGVQYKIKDVIRGTLPAVARYGLAKLQPSFDQLPIEVQKAILLQMVSQVIEHESTGVTIVCSCQHGRVAQCKFCDVIVHKCTYCGRKGDSKRCTTCHGCRKQTIFDTFAKEEIESSGCQCVCASAMLELEKIGL